MHRPIRLLPIALVLCAATPLAAPARAAMTYSPCLADAEGGAPTFACVTQTELGPVTSPPPPGEYLDPLTGIVYRDSDVGLMPVGTGTVAQFAAQTSFSAWGCGSSDPTGCLSPTCEGVMNAPIVYTPGQPTGARDLDGVSCQESRAALVGCWDIRVDYHVDYSTPFPGGPPVVPSQTYPGCDPSESGSGLPVGAHGFGAPATLCVPLILYAVPHPCVTADEVAQILNSLIPHEIHANEGTREVTGAEDVYAMKVACLYRNTDGRITPQEEGLKLPAFQTTTLTILYPGTQTAFASVGTQIEVC